MRIGELATLVGVSTRTVRHYHRLGLLPEPPRRANGYRSYGLQAAVELARVRRLAEIGLSLEEIRQILADDRGQDLRAALTELDADLAREQAVLAERRERLAALLDLDDLQPDSTVSPDFAAVLRELPTRGSRFAELDRELLSVIDTGADPAQRAEFRAMFEPLTEPSAVARSQALTAQLDDLDGAPLDDPRIEQLATDLADHLPSSMAQALADSVPGADEAAWLGVLAEELAPAQLHVLRRMVGIVRERAGC